MRVVISVLGLTLLAGLLVLSGCKKNDASPDAQLDSGVDAEAVEGPVTLKDVGGSCELDTECLTKICYGRTCRKACSQPADCKAAEDCGSDSSKHSTFCYERTYQVEMGQSCAVTGTCGGGMKCFGGQDAATAFCAGECKDATGCPPTMSCRMFDDSTAPGGKRGYCWKREFCSRCQHDGQCVDGGKCVKQGKESFCTLPCHQGTTECPRTADCKDTGGGVFQCLHRSGSCVGDGSMCQACLDDAGDCKDGALCLTFSFSLESFCATSCPTKGQSCEGSASYQCEAIALSATESVNQCVPYDKDPTKEISCLKPLSPTMEVGDTLPDYAMVGYVDEDENNSLAGETLRVVKLSEFASNYKVILFNVAAGWCGPCQTETKGFSTLLETYRKNGLMIFQVLYDGQTQGEKPTRALLTKWISALNAQGACGVDPQRLVAPYNTNGSTPLNMLVDARTRRVLAKWNAIAPPGFGSLDAALKKYLGL